ncbi:MAG: DUF2887 domain-containing protein [Alkalinema sp. RU_4_3]|nr:DUF2887 domain-containing protein [Alkalinema sp. RU_4_3]
MATDRLLGMIETILVYKFSRLTTKELEAMFGLSERKKPEFIKKVEKKPSRK